MTLHPAAWMAWTAASGALILSLDNPALLVVAIAALALVAATLAPERGPFSLMLKIGLVALAARTILFGLTGHPAGEIAFTVPQVRLPALLGGFTLGGPVAAPVLAHSAIEGLRLAALLCCVGVFLSAVEPTRVVRLMPRFLFEAGLAVAIAVAFVPSLLRSARDVRDAHRLRGERTGGMRGARLAVPILATTLERAVTVAESMEARGYGVARGGAKAEARARVATLAGVAAMTGGALAATVARASVGWVVLAAGAAVLAAAVRRLSALSLRTRYRRDRMRAHDWVVVAVAAAAGAIALPMQSAWQYSAYPSVAVPAVPAAGIAAVAAIAAPVAIARVREWRLRALSAEGAA